MHNKKIQKFQEEVAEFYSYLNIIEKNLSLSSTEIIKRILKQHNLSRTTLDRKFKKLYTPKNQYPQTLSTYIKRRQNKENILRGGRIFEHEERYDLKDILHQVKDMKIINNYKIYDIENIDNNNSNSNKNTTCNEYHYNNLGKDEYIVVIRKWSYASK